MTEPDVIVLDSPSQSEIRFLQIQEDINEGDDFVSLDLQSERTIPESVMQTSLTDPLNTLVEEDTPEPASSSTKDATRKKAVDLSDSMQETEEDEQEPEKYEVERLLGHKLYRGMVVKYHVKWKGYEDAYNTQEPASVLHEDCPEICAAYWDKHDPRPINAPKSKKRKINATRNISPTRETMAESPTSPLPAIREPVVEAAPTECSYDSIHGKYQQIVQQKGIQQEDLSVTYRSQGFVLGYGSDWPLSDTDWQTDLRDIHTVQYTRRQQELLAYVSWMNGKRTAHLVKELHERVPEKLLLFYEERLRFD
ncbi:hypothetical protein EC973_001550 [Apophysomyces ossiformis]|uniref:Chromo domain-containing protein n=1 Tax=Apophysomyces ossiformis TaxID=679940 RepID=A0A8H7BJF1_9FUNG|nr:hypothetical protein EC973_001550 [Apophysomyces ossiformis]